MFELRAVKKVRAKRVLAIATMKVKKERPDLVKLLKEVSNQSLSLGERENLISYLRFLGLIDRNGRRTDLGRDAERNGIIPMPEEGLYELIILDDWISVFTTKIINFKRSDVFGELKGEPFALDECRDIEASEHISVGNDEFTIHFHTEGTQPRVVLLGEEDCSIEIIARDDQPAVGIIRCKGGEIPLDLEGSFDLRTNMNNLIEDWERGREGRILEGLPMAFDDVRNDQGAVTSGVMGTYDLGMKPLWFTDAEEDSIMDDGEWGVELRNLRVVPKSLEDAKKWAVEAFYLKARKEPGYYKSAFAVNFANDLIEGRGYRNAFNTLRMSKEELLRTLSNIGHNDLLKEMRVADDLSPHERFFEVQKVN